MEISVAKHWEVHLNFIIHIFILYTYFIWYYIVFKILYKFWYIYVFINIILIYSYIYVVFILFLMFYYFYHILNYFSYIIFILYNCIVYNITISELIPSITHMVPKEKQWNIFLQIKLIQTSAIIIDRCLG